jgi:uncharacterized protein
MTPQESQLVNDLFDRLSKLETVSRDPAAERLIADGLQRAPHAVYALVQTTLLQDEALKRANARIEELQAQVDDGQEPAPRPSGFLDSMRESVFGRSAPRGSVPTVRTASYQSQASEPQAAYAPPGMPPPYPAGPAFGGGGSFLGNAASTAAGFIGGALLLDGIRSMFGHHLGGQASAFGNLGSERASPWSGSASDSQLARDAGIDHIGDHAHDTAGRQAASADDSFDSADADDMADDDDDVDVADADDFADGDFGGDDGNYDT